MKPTTPITPQSPEPQLPEIARTLEAIRYDMEYPYVPLAAMDPAPYNPRDISNAALEALAHSLKSFGLVQPLVWNKRTGHLVGGHQRYKILSRDGVKEAKTCIVDLDETEEQMLNIAMNNPALQGEFNMKMLADLVKILKSKKSAEEFKNSGLQRLAEQLPLFDGVKETQHPEEKPSRVKAADAVEQKLEKADIRMLQLFFNTSQHKELLTWLAVAAEACGTDNASDTVYILLREFATNLGRQTTLAEVVAVPTPEVPASPTAQS